MSAAWRDHEASYAFDDPRSRLHLSGKRRAPTPPPRDPSGINTIVQHVGEEQAHVMEFAVGRDGPRSEIRSLCAPSPSSALRATPGSKPHSVDDGVESDSSESSSSFSWRRSMESRRRQQDGSRLSSPGVGPGKDRGSATQHRRCSSYENVREEGCESARSTTPGFYPKKPPPSRPTRVICGSPQLPEDSPTRCPISATDVTMHRASPFSYHNSPPSPSATYPNGYKSRSGRNTPVTPSSVIPDNCGGRHGRISPWFESENPLPSLLYEGMDGDSTDSDPVRRRPPSSCKAPRSHRGSLPGECHAWYPARACSPCCGNLRFHCYGGTPQHSQNNYWTYCGYPVRSSNSPNYSSDDLQMRVNQLESEREHLLLQVNVLNEQIEAQNEKIIELEKALTESKDKLCSSETMLKQEVTSRSKLENSKLELMAQVSALRLQLATTEQERLEFEERSKKLESELVLAYACLTEKEAELATLKSKMTRNGNALLSSDCSSEIEKLRNALASVIAANDEKERKIQELQVSLNRYKKLQDLVFSGHARRASDGIAVTISNDISNSNDRVLEEISLVGRVVEKPPPVPRLMPHASASSPLPDDCSMSFSDDKDSLGSVSLSSPTKGGCLNAQLGSLGQRANSSENVSPPTPQKTPPAKRHYDTLPRKHGSEILHQIHLQLQKQKHGDQSPNLSDTKKNCSISPEKTSQSFNNLHHPGSENIRIVRTKTSGVSFGKGFFRLRSGKRSSSAPELALPEEVIQDIPDTNKEFQSNDRGLSNPVPILDLKDKPKGIKKIFGKLKRTGSENLDASEAEFKRGGIRATAGPRLGWTRETNSLPNTNLPFRQWDSNLISDWMHGIGLGMYTSDSKKWTKNGEDFMKCSASDLEKEFGIKNSLHKKKLYLALNEMKSKTGALSEAAGKLDYHWIIRWLDDIGLPQYKDSFFDSRIDGRVLHNLTVEDLFILKVTNHLHHISIRRGIQILRENAFDSHCLKRRSLPDDDHSLAEVAKWTNHRVMEWLRTVDLSEYAPNLRGSGVHGALLMYEPRFNADLLATLLNIPPNKTLLRRHLSTQFKQLVGHDMMQKKREWETQPNYSLLSPSAKVKAVRRGQFTLMRKRNKGEIAFEDLVCPIEPFEKSYSSGSSPSSPAENKKLTENIQNSSPERLLKKEEEIKNLLGSDLVAEKKLPATLKDEIFFETLATTNV